MTATQAIGCIALVCIGTAISLAALWARHEWRWSGTKKDRLLAQYLKGFNVCDRIRDREEVAARKERLLNGKLLRGPWS